MNIVWKCSIVMSNYWMAKQQVQSQANRFKDKTNQNLQCFVNLNWRFSNICMPRTNLKKTNFTNIVWKCPIVMSNYWMAKQQVQSQANHFKRLKSEMFRHFSTGDCMPRRNLRQVGWWRLSTFNNLLSEKCPIIMKNLLNGNFRDMYCCETFKVEEKTK